MGRPWGIERKRVFLRGVVGLALAAVMWFAYGTFALIAAGAGHGTYLPTLLLLAPFYTGPLVWCLFGALAANVERWRLRQTLTILLLVYYALALAWVVYQGNQGWPLFPGSYGDLPNGVAVLGLILVAVPHVWIWRRIADASAVKRRLS